ncbi:DNA topoisomerase IV, alpha subunit [Lojkania enalia]|uniref:DNA topoisomerase (ATP-hydrolyzing) n=1 Tax=Lojkania enalia TaxID=147567 RepID=A0A9P4NAH6_9PLEO|nr:DNA topoisomerase IV, alpha subunit [Didymosphaeria enalia]
MNEMKPPREEMLFELTPSQDALDNMRGRDSEDEELLDDSFDVELTPWTLRSSPLQSANSGREDPDSLRLDEPPDNKTGVGHPVQQPDNLSRSIRDRTWIIAHIEHILEKILHGSADEGDQLSITLRRRLCNNRGSIKSAQTSNTANSPKTYKISFPGNSVQEAWKFTVLVRILEIIHGTLVDNAVITKRDIYYRHPDLFVKQSVVDQYVDDLALTFGVSRPLLNVTAAAKGLVSGNFVIKKSDGTLVNGLSDNEGILIPKVLGGDRLNLSAIQAILVIEKEAAFQSVITSKYWSKMSASCVILTAKGYPDLASRVFLRLLAGHSPYIPMFILVDFDPDGIAIMSTYKHGSCRLAHESVTGQDTPTLSLPKLRWLGVHSHQISRIPVTECDTDGAVISKAQGFMSLTSRDRKRASRMLEWDVCAEDGVEPSWRRELQIMLMLNMKAEMQILEEVSGSLASWVNDELKGMQCLGIGSGEGVSRLCTADAL